MRRVLRFHRLAVAAALVASPGTARSAPPAPATFVAGDASGCGSISMTWSLAPGADGYEISRDGVPIARLGPLATRYIDYELWTPGTFDYCVRAFDGTGLSSAVCDPADRPVPLTTVLPEDWFHDVFPSNGDPFLPGTAAFARTTARVRTGRNTAPLTGDLLRAVDPGDNVVISTGAPAVSVDLIFRILPGPGNYKVAGNAASGLLVDPAIPVFVSVPGDGSYWGTLMAAPGAFATPGAAALHAAAPGGWSRHVWNSRPCLMPVAGVYTTIDAVAGTKIIPDDLLTPGAHVEYYFRIDRGGGDVELIPNPDCVMQLSTQQSRDGHRWEHFGVLPDLWKEPAYGGLGMPCMLVVDYDDVHGSGQTWASIADSIGATAPSRYGANTGWHAVGSLPDGSTVDLDDPANHRRPDGSVGLVDDHGGMPGTSWDYYRVRGAREALSGNAGSIGGRAGIVAAGETPPGPTIDMLDAYYPMMVLLTHDRSSQILGPFADRSQDDRGMLQTHLLNGVSYDVRGFWVAGNGFIESLDPGAGEEPMVQSSLAADLVGPSYSALSGDTAPWADLNVPPPISSGGSVYSIRNGAAVSNDVLAPDAGSVIAATYSDGSGAAVEHPISAPEYWTSLVTGFALQDLFSPWGANTHGRLRFVWDVLKMFESTLSANCVLTGSPLATLSAPDAARAGEAGPTVRNNPLRAGSATVRFALPAPAPVRVAVYDVAGRSRRVLVERRLDSGIHEVGWDGTDASGRRVEDGVYFVRLDTGSPRSARSTRLVVIGN